MEVRVTDPERITSERFILEQHLEKRVFGLPSG